MENHVRQRHLEMAFICRLCETGNIHYEPDLPSIKDHLKEDHSKDDLDNEDVKDYTRYPRLVQYFYTPTLVKRNILWEILQTKISKFQRSLT